MTKQYKNYAIAGAVLIGLTGLFWTSNSAIYNSATKDTSSRALFPGDKVDGMPCEKTEMLAFHVHSHLTIQVDGEKVEVPKGIGIGRPWTLSGSGVGGGSCFMWLHTHDAKGVIHVEAPAGKTFTLGNFFNVWDRPLSANALLDKTGPVTAYIDGQKYEGDPSEIELKNYQTIVLQIGTPGVVPPNYDFIGL